MQAIRSTRNPRTKSEAAKAGVVEAVSPKAHAAATRQAKKNGALVPDNLRRNYVEVTAYHIAEQRGFQCGSELEDWLQAEREVDRLLQEGKLKF